jgi:acetate kinase
LEGIQRYGFHGLSCESIVHQLANDLPNRLINGFRLIDSMVRGIHASLRSR